MPINHLIANPAGLDLPRAWGSAMKLADMKSQYDYEPRSREFGEALSLAKIQHYQQQKTQGTNDQQHKEAEGLARGVMSAPKEMRQQAYLAMKQEAISLGHANASQLPDQLTPEVEARLDMLARSGGTAEQYASGQAEARDYPAEQGAPVAAPPGVPLNQIQNAAPSIDPVSGAEVRIPNLAQPQGVPIAEGDMAPIEVTARRPDETPDSARARARAIRAKGGKANYEIYKDEMARAEKLDERIFKEQEKTQFFAEIGITGNKATGKYELDGKPISAAEVQKLSLAHAKAKAQSISIENLPNPIPVTDKNSGETKMVQFGNKGQVRETEYGPSKEANDVERLAAGFHDRMVAAEANIVEIGEPGHPSFGTAAAGALTGEMGERVSMTPLQQRYKQAQKDWVRAKLRKESGAVIADTEMATEVSTYFPMPGDSKEVIKQKEESRKLAQAAMNRSAGPALKGQGSRKDSTKAGAPPKGVDQKLWDVMTPEEKKLWN